MKSYSHIEDLLMDQSFKDWVLKGDPIQQGYWEKWQAENPGKVEMLKQARKILLELDYPGEDWTEQRQGDLFAKIQESIHWKEVPAPVYSSYRPNSETWTRAAIVIFLILACSVAVLKLDFSGSEGQEEGREEQKEVWITKTNPKGQKSTIQLPDGSTVFLNAESEIRYSRNFGQDQRDVFLRGESFFEVAPDSLLPFRVFSGELVTMALGTSFNINSYNIGKEQVQLASGKVKVYQETQEDQSYYLTPGEEVFIGADSKMHKREFDLHKAFLWKEGILSLEQVPFSEAVLTLERWYAVEIEVINPPFQEKKMSGEFKDTYLSNVLESLGYAYGFDYQIKNKEVVINFTQSEE